MGSITALFLRGFNLKEFNNHLKCKVLETPTMKVWLLEKQNYNDKLDAYKAGMAAENVGLGVYVLPDKTQWIWVAGVYLTESDAADALRRSGMSNDVIIQSYQILGKKIQVDSEVFESCQNILKSIENIFQLLLDLRSAINITTKKNNIQLDLTVQYNQIRNSAENLQTINATLHDLFVTTLIYTANQNTLCLQDIINTNSDSIDLAIINTALLKTIFSLDNF